MENVMFYIHNHSKTQTYGIQNSYNQTQIYISILILYAQLFTRASASIKIHVHNEWIEMKRFTL